MVNYGMNKNLILFEIKLQNDISLVKVVLIDFTLKLNLY
jgi:hypothetical protein